MTILIYKLSITLKYLITVSCSEKPKWAGRWQGLPNKPAILIIKYLHMASNAYLSLLII